jgi:hypothetical protein
VAHSRSGDAMTERNIGADDESASADRLVEAPRITKELRAYIRVSRRMVCMAAVALSRIGEPDQRTALVWTMSGPGGRRHAGA